MTTASRRLRMLRIYSNIKNIEGELKHAYHHAAHADMLVTVGVAHGYVMKDGTRSENVMTFITLATSVNLALCVREYNRRMK